MIHCPICESTDIKVKEQHDDGDGYIDIVLRCYSCNRTSISTVSQEDIDEYERDKD